MEGRLRSASAIGVSMRGVGDIELLFMREAMYNAAALIFICMTPISNLQVFHSFSRVAINDYARVSMVLMPKTRVSMQSFTAYGRGSCLSSGAHLQSTPEAEAEPEGGCKSPLIQYTTCLNIHLWSLCKASHRAIFKQIFGKTVTEAAQKRPRS